MGVMAVSNELPFKFKGDNYQYPSNQLPFKFGIDDDISPPDPDDDAIIVSSCYTAGYSVSGFVGKCYDADTLGAKISNLHELDYGVSLDVANCYSIGVERPKLLAACNIPSTNQAGDIGACSAINIEPTIKRWSCGGVNVNKADKIANCAAAIAMPSKMLKQCVDSVNLPVVGRWSCASVLTHGGLLKQCFDIATLPAVIPECAWYDIPVVVEPPVIDYPCGLPPPSNELYFWLKKPNTPHDSDKLPFRFRCTPSPHPIIKSTYMIYNNVTAEIDGQPLAILSLNLSTNTDGFCWSFDISIPPGEFDRLNLDTRSDDAIVTININRHRWDCLIESYSDTRKFVNYSYTLKGRSITSKLSRDYASRKTGIVTQAQSAAQLAQAQLALLPYTLEYQSVSWLIPGNTYTISEATPIDTIMDIAHAAGNFVESHPFEPKLYIKNRWPVGAWDINNQTPIATVPSSLVIGITGQKQIKDKCNSVAVSGTSNNAKGAIVRRTSAGSYLMPEASARTHELYTAIEVLREAGIAALSETGKHKSETVELPWDDTLQMPLGQMGQIWSISEPVTTGGYNGFKGIITGVAIKASLDNDAVVVTQSLTMDTYLDG